MTNGPPSSRMMPALSPLVRQLVSSPKLGGAARLRNTKHLTIVATSDAGFGNEYRSSAYLALNCMDPTTTSTLATSRLRPPALVGSPPISYPVAPELRV